MAKNQPLLIVMLLCIAPMITPKAHAVELKVGDVAPPFELPASDGKTYRLADFKGRSAVVVAWFPRAFTSGCTVECRSLAKNGHLIKTFNAAYFMASVDPVAENTKFAESENADFPLLSDTDKSVASAYGVLRDDKYALRHTFYIGDNGRILAIDRAVNPETSAEDMAATLGELGVAPALQ